VPMKGQSKYVKMTSRMTRISRTSLLTAGRQGRGNRGVRGSNDPRKFTWGHTWYFGLQIFWKEIFSGTHPHVLTEGASETRSRTVFFAIIYNRFVDSSKCGPDDFNPPPPVKNSSRAPAALAGVVVTWQLHLDQTPH